MRILKYGLGSNGDYRYIEENVVKWLEIKEQNGTPHIWAIIDDESDVKKKYKIWSVGTGWDLKPYDGLEYLGTCGDWLGYIWHYFLEEIGDED